MRAFFIENSCASVFRYRCDDSSLLGDGLFAVRGSRYDKLAGGAVVDPWLMRALRRNTNHSHRTKPGIDP